MTQISRRNFIKTGVAAATLAGMGPLPLLAERGKATDWVTLGRSGMKVTRLAFGTGTKGGSVQRALGQDQFTALVRHAYDSGIRFFETSESYSGMHEMLGIALKGIPREDYRLMTKVTTGDGKDPQTKIDELRRLAQTDYFDIMLLHVQKTTTWPTDTAQWQDVILENEHKQAVRTHGASVHGLPALRQVPDDKWLEIGMIRMNHKGVHMDAENPNTREPGNVDEVVQHVQEAKNAGKGVISMKLVGEGSFTNREDRQASMRFAFRHAGVNCVTVGTKSPAEVDEAIENVNLAWT
jgi:aryl-alcohol dehydrogenase-like predicted oxidoreductase